MFMLYVQDNKEYRLRVFENRVLRRIFGHKKEEVWEPEEDCIMRSFNSCTPHQILDQIMDDKMGGLCCRQWRVDKCIQNLSDSMKGRDISGDLVVDGE